VYSPETAYEMALTTRIKFDADLGIGITGSFGNVDPTNQDSVAGEIYFNIVYKEYENPIKLVYNHTCTPRKVMKQKTANIVLATLQTILTNHLC
jgi:nicotinamide mononucleotide (NMN) deamidase PncC